MLHEETRQRSTKAPTPWKPWRSPPLLWTPDRGGARRPGCRRQALAAFVVDASRSVRAASFWLGSYFLRRRGDDGPLRGVEAAAILFTVGLPRRANVTEILIQPTTDVVAR